MNDAPQAGLEETGCVAPQRQSGLRSERPEAAKARRIALVISSLNYGGAEVQATLLANGLARLGHRVSVIVFYARGPLRERLSAEVRVRCLGRRSRWDVIRLTGRFFSALAEEKPEVLYAFLPGANLVACLSKLRPGKLKVAWGVRASRMDLEQYDWGARASYWLEARCSRWPELIIANSTAGRRYAVSRGFPDDGRLIVIPNGIDVERFRLDEALRRTVRAEWGIGPGETLVGIVGRLDPMKDYPNFLAAAAKLAHREPDMRFVSVGGGEGEYAASLQGRARELGLNGRMIWAGERADVHAAYNALDLLVLSSTGEGFPNVLGEAMACGVPCVATDVGDAREILGDVGLLVPSRDPEALAAGVVNMLGRIKAEGAGLGARLRPRIVENFGVDALVRRTSEALERLVQMPGSPS